MFNRIICLIFGHKTERLESFKNRSIIQAIDDKNNKIFQADYCPRCKVIHGNIRNWK